MCNQIASAAHDSVISMLAMNLGIVDDPEVLTAAIESLLNCRGELPGYPSAFMYDSPHDMKVCILNSFWIKLNVDRVYL